MTVHRDRFLVNKTKRCTEFQINLLVIITLQVSGSLSAIIRSFSAVQRHWYSLCSSVTEFYQDQDHQIKLELSAYVGFIHK
jgi:hypothetical protein